MKNQQATAGNDGLSAQFLRRRRMLAILPFLILPFTTFAFWRLQASQAKTAQTAKASQGLNTTLPGAKLKNDKPENKLSLYDQQKRDSASVKSSSSQVAFQALGMNTANDAAASNESHINEKLAEIKQQINRPAAPPVTANPYGGSAVNPDMERLERLIKNKSASGSEDPEMKQLSGMLDKIMAIQNPSLAQAKAQKDKPSAKDSAFKAISAVIEGNQKALQGGVVKLRLVDSVILKNIVIPKGTLLFGSCNITNQRLLLDIKNIRLGTAIIPVDLSVFSLDGMPGINAPEAELGQAAGNGTDNALQSMEFLPMDQSLSIQAAGAGINAAKSLIGKKVKKIKVKLKGGLPILLRNNQTKNR